jgi:hypothetical protein
LWFWKWEHTEITLFISYGHQRPLKIQ